MVKVKDSIYVDKFVVVVIFCSRYLNIFVKKKEKGKFLGMLENKKKWRRKIYWRVIEIGSLDWSR